MLRKISLDMISSKVDDLLEKDCFHIQKYNNVAY